MKNAELKRFRLETLQETLQAFGGSLIKTSILIRGARSLAAAAGFRLFAVVLVAGFILMTGAQAQSTGSIDGIVLDTSGALIPGASVTLINEQSKARRITTSNSEGYFTITAIQANTYDLVVAMKGFESYRVKGLEIHPGDHQNIAKIRLKIGEVTQVVDVSATNAGVNLDSPEKSSIITADDIARLSTVGRDATELIKFLPGFAVSTGGTLNNISTANNAQTMDFGRSSTSSFSANGATPQTGATTVVSDGASVMDPGDMGASIMNVNMDMVQEIKVQTSNFGADSAKGPVVINAVGKSGGSSFHGSAYLLARNTVLNANDWYSNYNGAPRPAAKYYFPGANVGGPVLIPGTNFNHNKKLTFFTAFESYVQTVPDGNDNGLLLSFVPTAAMLTGDLRPSTIASALNISTQDLATDCPNFYTTSGATGSLGNSGGMCTTPGSAGSTYDYQGDLLASDGTIVNGGLLPIDPHAAIYEKFFPAPNRIPRGGHGYVSDGYNYQQPISDSLNGYQYRARVDENFTDNTKLYVTYNLEQINDETAIDNTYYAGSDIVPYPTPLFSHSKSNQASINFTKVFGPTLTNELIGSGVYFYEPNQFSNRNSIQDSTTGWPTVGFPKFTNTIGETGGGVPTDGRYYENGAAQLPGIRDYEEGVPDFAMGYIPASSAFLRKFSYNGGDNLTKQLRTHSIKVGVYAEVTANNQVPYNFTQGLYAFNHYNAACVSFDGAHGLSSTENGLRNNIANFLQGCSYYSQSSASTPANLHFKTLDFYFSDEWRATKRLMLTLAVRFEHLGPWYSPDGIGLAVWNPPAQHVMYSGVNGNAATYPGISWHQTNPAVPLSGQPGRALFYSPRVGLSFDVYGDGKTTMRGGWGVYRFHDSYNDSAGALSTTIGVQNYTSPTQNACTYNQIANQGAADRIGKTLPVGQGCPSSVGTSGSVGAFGITALDPHDDKQPVTYNYNFTVDQVMFHTGQLEMGYSGNRSADTFTEGNLNNQNFIPLGGLFQPDPLTGVVSQPGTPQNIVQDYRPYPNYTTVNVPNHIGYGNYNSLQISYSKQKGAFRYMLNYTWAKALGIRGDYRTGFVEDPSNLRNNYGYLSFNRNNAVNATYSWQTGTLYHGNRLVRWLVNNYEISGITSLQSGPDINALIGGGNFGLNGGISYTPPGASAATSIGIGNSTLLGTPDINLQPVLTCDPRVNRHNDPVLGHQYVNGSCFALPKYGTNGTFNLPDTHGPAYFDSDLSLQRDFKVKEKQELEFRLSGFNFLNHPLYAFEAANSTATTLTFGPPVGAIFTSPQQAFAAAVPNQSTFGYTPYKMGYRIVELTARYNF
jgi:hypothetical protein